MTEPEIKKLGSEWCAFVSGREVARAKDRALLDAYLLDALMGEDDGLTPEEHRAAVREILPRLPLTETTYTTRARSTGATTSAGRTESGFGVRCWNHGTLAPATNRTEAETAVSRPQEWCPGCARIASGEEPKFKARLDPAELEDLL